MRELSSQDVESVNGGIIPAVVAGFYAYNVLAGTYGAAAVWGYTAGFAFGAAMTYDQLK